MLGCSYAREIVTRLLRGNSKGKHLGMVKKVGEEELVGYKKSLSLGTAQLGVVEEAAVEMVIPAGYSRTGT